MPPDVFAILILFCAGGDVSARTCTIHKMEPPSLVSVEKCHWAAKQFAAEVSKINPEDTVQGVRCLTLANVMDPND